MHGCDNRFPPNSQSNLDTMQTLDAGMAISFRPAQNSKVRTHRNRLKDREKALRAIRILLILAPFSFRDLSLFNSA